jgi:hypothetical protein
MTKAERLADNRRRAKIANQELERRQKAEKDYLNSTKAKQLRKDVEEAIDAVNALVGEWNDIILEDYYKRERE